MPGKRTFSTAFPDEAPPKLKKRTTSTASKPSLKKASTLRLDDPDEEAMPGPSRGPSKRASTKSRPSLLKKLSSVEKGSLVSRLSGLKSGSIVGETSGPAVDAAPALSKKKSSVRAGPSVPKGLTKLALSKGASNKGSIRVYGSDLVEDIDETEMEAALESLKSKLSKSGSKASLSSKPSLSKAASKASLSKSASKASMAKSASVRSVADADDAGAVDPPLPPGGLMEIAISFDTTGSMYGCLAEVRAKVQDLVQRLQADIPGIRIAIIAHGDYCDYATYIVKWIDFGASLPELCDFVKNVDRTGGGDGPECYELVLLRAREALSWTPGSQRALIMINDDEPHPVGYRYGGKTYNIDWRHECEELAKMGVTVYGVQSGNDHGSTKFNNEMAILTGGKHLKLKDFNSIFDYIMMICYREANPDMIPIYAEEMKARKKRLKESEDLAAEFGAGPKGAPAPAGGLFGAAPAGGLFGAAPAPGGLFGAPPAGGGLFGAPGGGGGLFGGFGGGGLFGGFGSAKKVKKAKKVPAAGGKKGKAAAAAKGVKAAGKGAKGGKKAKKEPKVDSVIKRETVMDAKLSMGKLKGVIWSKWIKAMAPGPRPKMTKGKGKGKANDPKYINCRKFSAHRLKKLFEDWKGPALFEVAMSAPGKKAGKKHVVYFRRRDIAGAKQSWNACLFTNKNVRKEVQACMTAGCSMWVRQGTVKGRSKVVKRRKVNDAASHIKTTFDYAWKKYIWRKTGKSMFHRQLATKKKGGVLLSHCDW